MNTNQPDPVEALFHGWHLSTYPNCHNANQVINDRAAFKAGYKMNTNQPTPNHINGTFTFAAVVSFEIDPETAAGLLVESDPSETLSRWINQAKVKEDSGGYNTGNLRSALDAYLGAKAIEKARLLLPCPDVPKLPF